MAISYNAGTNTLTLDGVNTYSLNDIYNADVAGAWGVVTCVGEMYLFMCNLVVGDAAGNTTRLIDNDVGFQIGVTATRKTFQTLAGSSFEMTGCLLKFWLSTQKESRGSWEFSNTSIYEREDANICLYMMGVQNHSRCEFDTDFWYNYTTVCSYDRCLYKGVIFCYYGHGVVNDLLIENELNTYYGNPILKNSEIQGVTKVRRDGECLTLINCIFSNLEFSFASNSLLDKWEFNVLVTDKDNTALSGASVTLKDKNGDVKHSASTGVDGKLAAAWEVLANRYDGTSETKTEYNPFTLTVSKAAYTDYETEITIDHKIEDDQILLQKRKRDGILQY